MVGFKQMYIFLNRYCLHDRLVYIFIYCKISLCKDNFNCDSEHVVSVYVMIQLIITLCLLRLVTKQCCLL